jgi:virginiamycin B lyase
MRIRRLLRLTTAAGALLLLQAGLDSPRALAADAALSGKISSAEEGAMEGVVVTAHKEGSTVSISVISDDKGQYSFPAAKLEPGHYNLKIRAVGYDLDGSGAADVAAGKVASADLKLKKTKTLPLQMTNAEWLNSMPGTEEQKNTLLGCNGCHTYQRIVRSTHDTAEFIQVMTRMAGYSQSTMPTKPQKRIDLSRTPDPERLRKPAEFLASINLSQDDIWKYELKTLPRVKGRSTHVVITEYELPDANIQPHDVIVGSDGMAWYSDFGQQYVGKLDPKTGKVQQISLPHLKQGSPMGGLDLEADKDGNMWLGMMYQGAVAKIDAKSGESKIFSLPPELNDAAAQLNMVTLKHGVDGKLWTNDAGHQMIYRLDVDSGKYEVFDPLTAMPGGKGGYSVYGVEADSKNNAYLSEYQTNYIIKIDATSSKITYFKTPSPSSRPRRIQMDDKDQLWFAEYRGNRIGMFDTKSESFKEWPLPTPWTSPYYVTWDKNGELWTGGMNSDRVVRVNPKTGEAMEYQMPDDTNIRRVFIDNSTNPVTFWTGSNHAHSIVKVEPLD